MEGDHPGAEFPGKFHAFHQGLLFITPGGNINIGSVNGVNRQNIEIFFNLLPIARPVKVLADNKFAPIEACLSSKQKDFMNGQMAERACGKKDLHSYHPCRRQHQIPSFFFSS
jgi:hypothetical protein